MEADVSIYYGLGGAAVVAALVQVVKATLGVTDDRWTRWIPITSIVLGVAWNALVAIVAGGAINPGLVLFLGIFAGLSASGLYSVTTKTRP